MNVVQILKDARALIADEKNWTKRTFARSKEGERVGVRSELAFSFCSVGAIDKVCASGQGKAEAVGCLGYYLPVFYSVSSFNDERSHAEVLALFDRAIARAESEGA